MQLLNGDWKATAEIGSSLEFTRADFDDSAWETISVPGHWQETAAFSEYPEKLLYRKSFNCSAPAEGKKLYLRFEGVFYFARVWLNGSYLGEHTGYFEPFEFDATAAVREGRNSVTVFARCEKETVKNEKTQALGVFGHWDCIPGHIQPGGIWGGVSIVGRPPVFMESLSVGEFQIEHETNEAILRVGVKLGGLGDGADTSGMALRWTLAPHNFEGEKIEGEILLGQVDAEDREVTFDAAVQNPQLWWTWDRGKPNLYEIGVALIDPAGAEADSKREKFGIRSFELRDWIAHLNGKKIFCRGSNYAPGDARLAAMTAERYDRDIQLMLDANLNMIRVHAHVEKKEFYDACDRAGILVWQDFPLQWYYAQEIEAEAVRQIQGMVNLLGNHPSVAVWCCHNEPFKELELAGMLSIKNVAKLRNLFDPGALPMMHNWNKNVLDEKLKEAVLEIDTSRPVVKHSGVPPMLGGVTDSHFYFGWYMGTMRGLAALGKFNKRSLKFLTEYGAQAFPSAGIIPALDEAKSVAGVDWAELVDKHTLQKSLMDKFAPPKSSAAVDEYISMTQWYQARLIRYHNEYLRRLKYDPCGGAVHFMFNDSLPAVTWAVVDSARGLKQGYYALRDSFRQLLPCADFPKRWYPCGDVVALRLFAINDHDRDIPGAILKWAYINSAGDHLATGEFPLDLAADGVERLGRARWDSADAPPGGYALVLELSAPSLPSPVTNQYEFELRK